MAYFANGTEGLGLEEQCHNCIHGINAEILCPVASVQLMYNYSQLDEGNKDLREAMNLLIDEQGSCLMRQTMEKAGITFDFSEREQLPLI